MDRTSLLSAVASAASYALPALLGALSGAASMLLYGRLSPQTKLQHLKQEMDVLQRQLTDFDGDFSGAMALTRQNLRLAFKRLALVLLPSLASSIPVLAVLPVVSSQLVVFFIAAAVFAIGVKYARKIA